MTNEKFKEAICEAFISDDVGMIPPHSEHIFSTALESKMQKLIASISKKEES